MFNFQSIANEMIYNHCQHYGKDFNSTLESVEAYILETSKSNDSIRLEYLKLVYVSKYF